MTALVVTATVGVVFGFALAAPPGPMNAIIAEESVLRGWLAGFRAGVGAVLGDVIFFFLAYGGVVAVVSRYPFLESGLSLVGGALMLLFAAGALRGARTASTVSDAETEHATGFQRAFVLSLTNPYQIGFWLTVGVGLITPGSLDVFAHLPLVADGLGGLLVVETGSSSLLLGFFGGLLLWVVAFPAALVTAGRRVDNFAPAIAVLSGVTLAGFGVFFLAMGVLGLR